MSDKRTAFFALASVLCFTLTPLTFPDHRWVPVVIGSLYAVFALASLLEAISRARTAEKRVRPDRHRT